MSSKYQLHSEFNVVSEAMDCDRFVKVNSLNTESKQKISRIPFAQLLQTRIVDLPK